MYDKKKPKIYLRNQLKSFTKKNRIYQITLSDGAPKITAAENSQELFIQFETIRT